MRILLIATVRTGGRQLSEWIAKELNYLHIHEPNINFKSDDDIVVKYLVYNIVALNMEFIPPFNPDKWDKIITLKRNDIRAAAESFTYAQQNESYHSTTYSINNKWIQDNECQINKDMIDLVLSNDVIDKIDFAGLKLTYEGVYETGKEIPMLEKYLGITKPKYKDMLNYKNKLRKKISFI